MGKMSINQVRIGSIYNSEEYFKPAFTANCPTRYFFTGDNCSAAVNMIDPKLPPFPQHAHPHEQFIVVLQGDGTAIVDGKEYEGEEGFFAYIPSALPHGYNTTDATYTCWNLDIFYPERLEYEKETTFRLLAQGKDPMKTMVTKDTDI